MFFVANEARSFFFLVTIVYAVLFLEWDENDRRGNPFADVRKYFFDSMNSVFTRRTGQDPRKPVDSSSTES